MSRLENILVYELLNVAQFLADQSSGRASEQNARRRRAVSSAYYALFHALSSVCADTLSGRTQDADVADLVYRALGHAELRKTLKSADARRLAPGVASVAEAFAKLQERRYDADYADPGLTIGAPETFDAIEIAREAILVLAELDPKTRLRLAVLLLATSRQRQAPR